MLTKVIYPKYYINSNESCTFLFVGRLGRQGSTKFSAVLLKYPTFVVFFLYVHGYNFIVLGIYNFEMLSWLFKQPYSCRDIYFIVLIIKITAQIIRYYT